MNIWISSRVVAGLALLILLAGCLDATRPGGGRPGFVRKPPETISVARGAVVVAGPQGYCIDRGGSRLGGDTAFVLLGSCASIAGDAAAGVPPFPGILTASVAKETGAAPATDAVLDQLARFIATPAGRAMLARNGQAETVDVLQSMRESRAVLIRLRDRGAGAAPGLDADYWRGFFDLNGRLITLSVIGFESAPMSADAGLATLRRFLARIRAATPQVPDAGTGNIAPRPRKGLFQGLFN